MNLVELEASPIDAVVVAWLRELDRARGGVWAHVLRGSGASEEMARSVELVLENLACVSGVGTPPPECGQEDRAIRIPAEVARAARERLRRAVPEDDSLPDGTAESELEEIARPAVLLTGCFDLIHAGHIELIRKAGAWGRSVVMGCLTTRAIRAQPKNQGRRRPLWSMAERLDFVRALRNPPRVVFFDGPDSLGLIERLRPDVYVKEKRDREREIVQREAEFVGRFGGRVVWTESSCGISTTSIAEEMLGVGAPG